MLNEGIIVNDAKTVVKSEMVRQLRRLERATPDEWERAVFTAFTGQKREDVDWRFEDNQAGEFLWLKSFDKLVLELVDDGYVREVTVEGQPMIEATDAEEVGSPSQLVQPELR
jgi:hypothetical protein